MAERKLVSTVHIHPSEACDEGVIYEAGDVPTPEHAALITNKYAWEDDVADNDNDEDGNAALRAADVPRRLLLEEAKALGLEPGKDFNRNAHKDVIARAIRLRQGRSTAADAVGDSPHAVDAPLMPGYEDDAAPVSRTKSKASSGTGNEA